MNFLQQLSQHTNSGIDIDSLQLSQGSKRKLASMRDRSFVVSNIVPMSLDGGQETALNFVVTNQKDFFLITTIDGGNNNNNNSQKCRKLTSCHDNNNVDKSTTSVTALHLISISSTSSSELLMIAAFDDQSFHAWIISSINSSSSPSPSLLLGFAETDSRIVSIMDVKFDDTRNFFLVFGAENCASCSVVNLKINYQQNAKSSTMSANPGVKHFSVKSDREVRIIVDKRKFTLSIVWDKNTNPRSNSSETFRCFKTYFLPAVFSSATNQGAIGQNGIVLSGRFIPGFSSPSRSRKNDEKNTNNKSPVIRGKSVCLEDADQLRRSAVFDETTNSSDHEIVAEVLLHFTPTTTATSYDSSSSTMGRIKKSKIYLDEETVLDQAKRYFFQNLNWISGGISGGSGGGQLSTTISPDDIVVDCSIIVDFPNLLQHLKISVNYYQEFHLSNNNQTSSHTSGIHRMMSNIGNMAFCKKESEELLVRALKISEFAIKLLLARPDERKSTNNNVAANVSRSIDIENDDDREENKKDDIDFSCVAKLPTFANERAILGVYAIAIVTILPINVLKNILELFSSNQEAENYNNDNSEENEDSTVFAVAGMIVDVIWPTKNNEGNAEEQRMQVPQFLASIIPFLLHSSSINKNNNVTNSTSSSTFSLLNSTLRESSKFLFGACLDRLASKEKFALESALVRSISPSGKNNQENSPRGGEATSLIQDSWDSAFFFVSSATPMLHQSEALIALLLLIRSVRVQSAPHHSSSSSTPSPSSTPTPSTPNMMHEPQQQNHHHHPRVRHEGLTQEDLIELGNYSPSPKLIDLVGTTVVETARNYRCRGSSLADPTKNNSGNNNNNNANFSSPSLTTTGAALQVISESWSVFGGFVPILERKLMVARLIMDAVIRHDVAANSVLNWHPSKGSGNSNNNHVALIIMNPNNTASPGNEKVTASSSSTTTSPDIAAIENEELTHTFPLIKMLAKIGSTMNLARAIELFAWVCTLDGGHTNSQGGNADSFSNQNNNNNANTQNQLKQIAEEADIHDNIGVSIVVLRILTHLIEIHPVASRRFIHNILSFVWAAIDPSLVNLHQNTAATLMRSALNTLKEKHQQLSSSSSPSPSSSSSSQQNNQYRDPTSVSGNDESIAIIPKQALTDSTTNFILIACQNNCNDNNGNDESTATTSNSASQSKASTIMELLPHLRPKSRLPFVSQLFNVASECIPTFSFHHASQRLLASSGDDGRIVLYDSKSTSKLAVFGPAFNNNPAAATSSNNNNSVAKIIILALTFSPNGDACAVLQQYTSDSTLSLAVYGIGESSGFFSAIGLAAAITVSIKTEVPVLKGNGQIAASGNNIQIVKPKVIFASPKAAIVSFGNNSNHESQDILVHF